MSETQVTVCRVLTEVRRSTDVKASRRNDLQSVFCDRW